MQTKWLNQCYNIKKDEFEKNGYKINSVITDLGTEYNNSKFKNLFDGVKLFRKNDETFNSALAVVDRVMKTIRGYFKKLFVLNNNFVWINDLFNIQNNYNNTFHKTIQTEPDEVFYKKVKPNNENFIETDRLNVGDKVRIKTSNKKNIFDKKYNTIWSNDIYTITGFEGIGYLLDNGKRKYFRSELLPIDKNTINDNENSLTLKDLKKKKEDKNQSKITEFFKSNKINNKIKKVNKMLN